MFKKVLKEDQEMNVFKKFYNEILAEPTLKKRKKYLDTLLMALRVASNQQQAEEFYNSLDLKQIENVSIRRKTSLIVQLFDEKRKNYFVMSQDAYSLPFVNDLTCGDIVEELKKDKSVREVDFNVTSSPQYNNIFIDITDELAEKRLSNWLKTLSKKVTISSEVDVNGGRIIKAYFEKRS